MISSDIDASVSNAITLDMVIERMVELSERAAQTIRDAASDCGRLTRVFYGQVDPTDDTHRKTASFSSCYCPYCSAIKAYVHAKRAVRRLDLGGNESMMGGTWAERLRAARTRLEITRALKDQMTERYAHSTP